MAWLQVLYETYESNKQFAGVSRENEPILLPVAHSTVQAQIEVTIDVEGDFVRAETIQKNESETIIPVTEDSATRSSGIAPHPLNDKLCYVAGDYDEYPQQIDLNKKEMEAYYKSYINALKNWAESTFATDKVIALYSYLSKKTLIKDLINAKVLIQENGKMSGDKISNIYQMDCVVRFKVRNLKQRRYIEETWKDLNLYKAFESYYMQLKSDKRVCYATGLMEPYTEKHGAKIRNVGDKAKLISANDKVGFTFRGRFSEVTEAATVSYRVSQEAHNALRWLVEKQGYRNETANIIVWSSDNSKIIDLMKSSEQLIAEEEDENAVDENDEIPVTGESYAKRLGKALAGYKADLVTKAQIRVMSIDTADGSAQGRLAITYYRELDKSKFIEYVEKWHKSFKRYKVRWQDGESQLIEIGAPAPREIVRTAYGIERNNMLEVDSKLMKNQIERLLPCIISDKRLPYDLVKGAQNNTSRVLAFSKENWYKLLCNTCALMVKYENDLVGEKRYSMVPDEKCVEMNKDRSYLFGKLLALADFVERRTYDYDSTQVTNAKRYMSAFVKKPVKSWELIHARLQPYLNKSHKKVKGVFEEKVMEIMSHFNVEENGFSDKSLDGLYLLGFYHQLNELELMKNNKTNKNEGEVE